MRDGDNCIVCNCLNGLCCGGLNLHNARISSYGITTGR